MGPLGFPELLIILVVALIVFGPRKLPELGRSLGKSLSEFKRASNELRSTLDEEIRLEERKAVQAVPPAPPAASTDPADLPSPAAPETIARGQQGS
jgi:TatA/E family protein of Tat protein translocase